MKRNVLILTTKALSRTFSYRNFVFHLKTKTKTLCLDDWPALIDDGELTEEEKDAIGEIANISMGTAATTLYSLVNNKVTITTPTVSLTNWERLAKNYDRPCVFIQLSYTVGLDGKNILV